jgi:hypothetical protein
MCTSVEAVMSSVALQETQPLLVSRTQAVTELAVEWTTAMHFSAQGFLEVKLLREYKDTKAV